MENTSTTSKKRSQRVNGLSIKQIVVAVDLTAHSEKTVAYAIEIARTFGARIYLAYVQAPESITEYTAKGGNENLEEKRHDPVQELTDLNKSVRRIYPNCGADFRVRLFNLDQAPKIMHRAPCSVLVYHDQHDQ